MTAVKFSGSFSKSFGALLALVIVNAIPVSSSARIFRNAYVQFELPDRWECNLEGTEWVCSSQNKNDAKESIIILTAKEAGPQDSFMAYEQYLKAPKQVPSLNGKPVISQVKNERKRRINDHDWVDSLHLGSEIPGYYTRYLATVKDKLAILVTFSAHQKYYTKYSNDFFRAIESLRVVASKDLLAPKLAPIKPGVETIGQGNPGGALPNIEEPAPPSEEGAGGLSSADMATYGGIGLLILAILFFMTKKRSR